MARTRAAQIVSIGGTTLLTGGLAFGRERKRLTDLRNQHAREMAQGKKFDAASSPIRNEMEQYRYETMAAGDLTQAIRTALSRVVDEHGRPRDMVAPEHQQDLIDALALANARVQLSDQKSMDLIGYSGEQTVDGRKLTSDEVIEKERLALDIAIGDAGAALRDVGIPLSEINRTREDEAKRIVSGSGDKSIESKNRLFKGMRNSKAVKAAVKGMIIGGVVGEVYHEAGAALGNTWVGDLLGHTRTGMVGPDHAMPDGSHHYTPGAYALGWLKHYFNGDPMPGKDGNLMHEALNYDNHHVQFKVPQGLGFNENPDGTYDLVRGDGGETVAGHLKFNPDGTFPPETRQSLTDAGVLTSRIHHRFVITENVEGHESTSDYLAEHPGITHTIKRDLHYDNDTPEFDRGELRMDWGGEKVGENATGLTADGKFIFNVSRMTSGSSFHGSETINVPQLINEGGHLKVLLSLSHDTQNEVFEFPVDADGNAIIDPNSIEGARAMEAGLFSVDTNGHAIYNGRFAEIAQTMGERNGVEHVRILATHEGDGIEEISCLTPKTTIDDQVRVIFYPPQPETHIDWPIPVPIVPGRPMESTKKGEQPSRRSPEEPRSPERPRSPKKVDFITETDQMVGLGSPKAPADTGVGDDSSPEDATMDPTLRQIEAERDEVSPERRKELLNDFEQKVAKTSSFNEILQLLDSLPEDAKFIFEKMSPSLGRPTPYKLDHTKPVIEDIVGLLNDTNLKDRGEVVRLKEIALSWLPDCDPLLNKVHELIEKAANDASSSKAPADQEPLGPNGPAPEAGSDVAFGNSLFERKAESKLPADWEAQVSSLGGFAEMDYLLGTLPEDLTFMEEDMIPMRPGYIRKNIIEETVLNPESHEDNVIARLNDIPNAYLREKAYVLYQRLLQRKNETVGVSRVEEEPKLPEGWSEKISSFKELYPLYRHLNRLPDDYIFMKDGTIQRAKRNKDGSIEAGDWPLTTGYIKNTITNRILTYGIAREEALHFAENIAHPELRAKMIELTEERFPESVSGEGALSADTQKTAFELPADWEKKVSDASNPEAMDQLLGTLPQDYAFEDGIKSAMKVDFVRGNIIGTFLRPIAGAPNPLSDIRNIPNEPLREQMMKLYYERGGEMPALGNTEAGTLAERSAPPPEAPLPEQNIKSGDTVVMAEGQRIEIPEGKNLEDVQFDVPKGATLEIKGTLSHTSSIRVHEGGTVRIESIKDSILVADDGSDINIKDGDGLLIRRHRGARIDIENAQNKKGQKEHAIQMLTLRRNLSRTTYEELLGDRAGIIARLREAFKPKEGREEAGSDEGAGSEVPAKPEESNERKKLPLKKLTEAWRDFMNEEVRLGNPRIPLDFRSLKSKYSEGMTVVQLKELLGGIYQKTLRLKRKRDAIDTIFNLEWTKFLDFARKDIPELAEEVTV